jgi:hypothetical protein
MIPYPGIQPNIKILPKTGGRHRNCFVIELQTIEELSAAERAQVKEFLETHIQKLDKSNIEKAIVASSEQFDKPLSDALRLDR